MGSQEDLIKRQFGANASKYATSEVHARGTSLERLVALTQPRRDWLVLDVSTGAGHTALAFAPFVAQVIATDLTMQMLETAHKLASERGISNIEFRFANAQALPFEDNLFDLVTNRIALHHYADPQKAIAEMARVLKPGGLVGLTDNIVPPDKVTAGHINHFEKERDPSHNWAFPVVRLQAMLANAGLAWQQSELLSKEMDFEPWADRMSVEPELKAQLRRWLDEAPDPVKDWLAPRHDDDRLFFTLHEAVLVARKG